MKLLFFAGKQIYRIDYLKREPECNKSDMYCGRTQGISVQKIGL